MALELPFQQIVGDAFVIEQPARRLPERRIAERRRRLGVELQEIKRSVRNGQGFDARLALQGRHLVCPRLRAISASPCSISKRRAAGSGTFLIRMVFSVGAPSGEPGLASSTTTSCGT